MTLWIRRQTHARLFLSVPRLYFQVVGTWACDSEDECFLMPVALELSLRRSASLCPAMFAHMQYRRRSAVALRISPCSCNKVCLAGQRLVSYHNPISLHATPSICSSHAHMLRGETHHDIVYQQTCSHYGSSFDTPQPAYRKALAKSSAGNDDHHHCSAAARARA